MKKDRWINIFFLVFAARIMFLILVPPFIGIANNGDFRRLMIPCGVDYQVDPWGSEKLYHENFFNWVTNQYVYIEPIKTSWHQIFSVFLHIAIILSNRIMGGSFDIRYLGIVNAVFYLFAVFVFMKLLERIQSIWKYILICITLLVLGDSFIIQYFNSFYSEIGSVTGVLFLWDLFIIGFLYMKNNSKICKTIYLFWLSVAASFAILSKQQDILLIIPVLIWFVLLARKIMLRKRSTLIWIICFVAFIGMAFINNKGAGNETTFNVISMDLLGESEYPEEQLRRLGLSDSDIDIITTGKGKDPYGLPYDRNLFSSRFTRKDEIKILMREPEIFLRMAKNRAHRLFYDVWFGNYMKDSGAKEGEKTNENRVWYKIKNKIYVHNLYFYLGICMFSIILGITGGHICYLSFVPKELFAIYLFLPISNILRFLTVLVGDSSHDDLKHFFATNFEFDIIFICSVILSIIVLYGFMKKVRLKMLNAMEVV